MVTAEAQFADRAVPVRSSHHQTRRRHRCDTKRLRSHDPASRCGRIPTARRVSRRRVVSRESLSLTSSRTLGATAAVCTATAAAAAAGSVGAVGPVAAALTSPAALDSVTGRPWSADRTAAGTASSRAVGSALADSAARQLATVVRPL